MKATGEVMGVDREFTPAVAKALLASGLHLSRGYTILISISDRDKPDAVALLHALAKSGCDLYATEGTAEMIKSLGLEVPLVAKKLGFGHPNVVDVIEDGKVQAVINTVTGSASILRDGYEIRRSAVEHRIPCFTSLDTARAAVDSLVREDSYNVLPVSRYLGDT